MDTISRFNNEQNKLAEKSIGRVELNSIIGQMVCMHAHTQAPTFSKEKKIKVLLFSDDMIH